MIVTLRYHALLREKTGKTEEALDLPPGAAVGDALKRFAAKYAALAPLLPSLQVAVNDEFAARDGKLRDGDVVDLLPPFGGG